MRVAGAVLWQRSTPQRHGCVGLGEINMSICRHQCFELCRIVIIVLGLQ